MEKENSAKRVKIVATLGPATRELDTIEKIYLAGVNVFRLNFSHGSYDEQKYTYDNIRSVAKKYGTPVAILADMQGPKLRVGKFKDDKATLVANQKFTLDLKDELGDETRVKLPHPQIFEAVKEGDALLVDDGKIRLEVERFAEDFIETRVVIGGVISNAKGVNFPSGVLKISALTEKDLKDMEFALSLGVDYIGLSFVQLPADVEHARELIKGKAKIISKIEKPSAIEHIEEIIKVSDAIMVARGDLGVEIPTEKVPVMQKKIIRECRRQSKPVIVATQMLDSMTTSPVPTRAEASDVANAVYDGTDAVMLSGETTVGLYPVETVTTMANIIRSVEADSLYWDMLETSYKNIMDSYFSCHEKGNYITVGRAIAKQAKELAKELDAKVIVSFSAKGTTANRISHQKSKAKMLTITNSKQLYNQLALNWGMNALLSPEKISSFSEIVEIASSWLKEQKWVKSGDKIVIVAGVPVDVGGITNTIRVVEIS
ncbi:MAG: pyruvate kinase [Alphaproteobacteria bacterium]|jgi:pyruvate kinase|nr:pyruvate kinase [Alphaproteobacteria bacterium]